MEWNMLLKSTKHGTNMLIIGLSGKRGSGKTTLANYLVETHRFVKVSFAAELKRIARELFPFTEADVCNPKNKESKFRTYDWSPRDFLINLGEFMRYHDKSYWLKRGMSQCTNPKGRYVFEDVRYKNEAERIKEDGGKLVRVNRFHDKNPYGKPLDTPSETDLDNHSLIMLSRLCQYDSYEPLSTRRCLC